MAISGYVGLPGHGKSYGAVQYVIIPALRAGRRVFTNIPMNDDVVFGECGRTVDAFDVADIQRNENWWTEIFVPGSLLVLDECWRLWPSGLKANNARESDKSFLAEHRHMVGENGLSTEIYLVTQDLGQLASFVRALVETTYRMVKLSNLGLDKRFRVDIYNGPVTGPKPSVSAREREIHGGKFSADIWRFYRSHTKSETGLAGDETKTDKRANAFNRFSIKAGFVFVIACIWLVFWGLGELNDRFFGEPVVQVELIEPAVQVPTDPAVQRPAPRPKLPAFLKDAKTFFVSMTLGQRGSREYFYTAEFTDHRVFLTGRDLEALGYQLVAVNDCLVRVSGHDYNGYAMCRRPEEKQGILQQIMPGSAETL
jgi:zona occludens toxin